MTVARTAPTVGDALLDELLDAGSLRPIRTQVRSLRTGTAPPGDGVLCGTATMCGRDVVFYAQDTSVLGGSLGETHADGICRALDLAARLGRPVVGVHRSGGARIQEGVASLAGYARIFARHVRLRDRVPQIALVSGPCAGGAAYGPALMDFLVMPADGAYLFLTGPDVVREVTGEEVGFADLGGAHVAGRSGLASLVGTDEQHIAQLSRRLVSYLPSRIGEEAPILESAAPDGNPGEVVPQSQRATYDVREVIERVVDAASMLELKPAFAPNLVTALGRLDGRVVGIVANQPLALAGAIDEAASRKGAWFVDCCDRFRFPLLVLVDTPGFLPGTTQELAGVIPAGASFLASFVRATVPKLTVVLRKAYGGAFIVMNALALGADAAYAWPSAEIAVLGPRGAVRILHRRRLREADDPRPLQEKLEAEYREHYCSPWPAAEGGFVDEVIDPATTRDVLSGVLSG